MLKPNIINRFLLRRFFYGFGLIMLVVCGIILAVTFVERLPDNPTAFEALKDSWIRLMEYVPLFLPVAVFMGTLFASYNLIKSSEMIIISSAGMSPYQSAKPFFFGAFLIGLFATTVINPYSVKLNSQFPSAEHFQLVDNSIWLRESTKDGYITITAKGMHRNDEVLIFDNVKAYTQTKDFKLDKRIEANTIVLSSPEFFSENARVWDSAGVETSGPWRTQTSLTTQTVMDRYLQPDQISFWELPKFIERMKSVNVPVRGHLVQFWTLLFLPLTMIAMATLGVAFSQTRQRRNYSFGIKFGLGILTCFAVYFLINMFNALGATGALPPLLAIIAPPLIIIAASGVFIASFDTI